MLSSIKKDKNRRILVKKFEIKRIHAKVIEQDNLLKNYLKKSEINFLPDFVIEGDASPEISPLLPVGHERYGNETNDLKKNHKSETLLKGQIPLYSLLHEKASKTIPRNSSKSRVKNRCIKTGRSHAVFKFCRLSRIALREEASKGLIPGVNKTSW